MKVWIVLKTSYSDTVIVGVYRTWQRAYDAKQILDKNPDVHIDVEEWMVTDDR